MRVFWCVMMERNIHQLAVLNLLDVAGIAAQCKALRINQHYQRTDMARNNAVKVFLKHAKDEDDALVMLDADHTHPQNIIPRLVQQLDAQHEIIGALAFRRSIPHDPCFYTNNPQTGGVDVPTQFSGKLERCDIVGTGAIAIRRSVFAKLDAVGRVWPYFRYVYQPGIDNDLQRSEDWEFGLACQEAGVAQWVDTGCETPHITDKLIGHEDWFNTLREVERDPDAMNEKFKRMGMTFTKA